MKKHRELHIIRKISMVFIIFVVLFQFMMPIRSQASDLKDDLLDAAGDVLKYMSQIIAGFGDLAMGAFNNFFLGTDGFSTAMIDSESLGNGSWYDNDGVSDDSGSVDYGTGNVAIGEDEDGKKIIIYVKADSIENSIVAGSENWEVPNLLYCPENIFGNNIAMLDVNFLNPNEYEQVVSTQSGGKAKESIAGRLKTTIVSWYRSFRNLAIVALLSILVYLGIRILISSTSEDKAKYKQSIKDWLIALCLVFVMHFIMSAIIMVVNQVNTLFQNVNNSIYVNYGGTIFQTNFTGAIRFLAQSNTTGNAWVYTVIYWVLICYTCVFTIQYLKRVLYIAFYTMISPLVAITYPIDKLGDGKSQAFNHWLKEYIMTMALQPIHLIIYSMIVASSLSLSIENPIFALVAIGFLIPAEKFIRSLFGVNSQADGGFGAFASGALSMHMLNSLKKERFGGADKKGKLDKGKDSEGEDNKIRQANNKPFSNWMNGNKAQNNEEEDPKQLPQEQRERVERGEPAFDKDEGMDMSSIGEQENQNAQPIESGQRKQQEIDSFDTESSAPQIPETRENEQYIFEEPNKEQMTDIDNPDSEYWNNFDDAHGIDQEALREDMNNNPDKYDGYDYDYWLANARNNALEQERLKDNQRKQQEEAEQKAAKEKYDNMRYMRRDKWERKQAKRVLNGVKKGGLGAAKFVAKTGLRAMGAATLGTVGLAAGIATGKGLEGAIKGAGAGVAAGIAVGSSVANLAGRGTNKVIKGVKKEREAVHNYQMNKLKDLQRSGLDEEAKKYEHSATLGRFAPYRAKNIEKYSKLVDQYALKKGKRMKKDEREDMMQRIYDYDVNYGVTDKDKIFKGLDLEEKYKDKFKTNTHDTVAGVMQLTNQFSEKYINDSKSNQEFRNAMEKRGISKRDQENIMDVFHAAYEEKYQPQSDNTKSEKTSQTRTTSNDSNAQGRRTQNRPKDYTTSSQTTQDDGSEQVIRTQNRPKQITRPNKQDQGQAGATSTTTQRRTQNRPRSGSKPGDAGTNDS